MKKGLFVSSTSTGIGKTVFSAIICRILAGAGNKVAYHKPVQAGAVWYNGRRRAPDCLFLETALRQYPGSTVRCSYLLQKPASPHYAARLENMEISLEKIMSDYRELAGSHDYVVVEGAGGLYVPVDDRGALVSDIPAALDLNLVLVAEAGLGTINHTALSHFYTTARNIHMSAVILVSSGRGEPDIEKENLVVLKKITSLEEIHLVPAVRNVDVDETRTGNLEKCAAALSGVLDPPRWINA